MAIYIQEGVRGVLLRHFQSYKFSYPSGYRHIHYVAVVCNRYVDYINRLLNRLAVICIVIRHRNY